MERPGRRVGPARVLSLCFRPAALTAPLRGQIMKAMSRVKTTLSIESELLRAVEATLHDRNGPSMTWRPPSMTQNSPS